MRCNTRYRFGKSQRAVERGQMKNVLHSINKSHVDFHRLLVFHRYKRNIPFPQLQPTALRDLACEQTCPSYGYRHW